MWYLWAKSPDGTKTLLNQYTAEQEVWLTRDLIWIHNRDRVNHVVRALLAEWV